MIVDFIQTKGTSSVVKDLKVENSWFEQTLEYIPSTGTYRLYGMDVTARKHAEEAMQRYARELETHQSNLEEMVEQRTLELQTLSHRLIMVQEDERRSISRELHDQTGQSLTVLNLLLARAMRSPEISRANLQEAVQMVREILSQVRNLSTSLHPGMLEDLGLMPTLTWYFNDFDKKTGIKTRFEYSGFDTNLPADINITIYRIIQEALTNIVKYAEVNEADVRLKVENRLLSIVVEDKGKGFEMYTSSLGVGLRGMRERVNALKGKLTVTSAPGAGTRIEVDLPIA